MSDVDAARPLFPADGGRNTLKRAVSWGTKLVDGPVLLIDGRKVGSA